jgi:hypothetical protein
MAIQANQLAVKQSADTAEMVAAAIFDAVRNLPRSTGVEKTIVRQLTKHAHEVLSLHDLKADEVMPDRGTTDYIPTEG